MHEYSLNAFLLLFVIIFMLTSLLLAGLIATKKHHLQHLRGRRLKGLAMALGNLQGKRSREEDVADVLLQCFKE